MYQLGTFGKPKFPRKIIVRFFHDPLNLKIQTFFYRMGICYFGTLNSEFMHLFSHHLRYYISWCMKSLMMCISSPNMNNLLRKQNILFTAFIDIFPNFNVNKNIKFCFTYCGKGGFFSHTDIYRHVTAVYQQVGIFKLYVFILFILLKFVELLTITIKLFFFLSYIFLLDPAALIFIVKTNSSIIMGYGYGV